MATLVTKKSSAEYDAPQTFTGVCERAELRYTNSGKAVLDVTFYSRYPSRDPETKQRIVGKRFYKATFWEEVATLLAPDVDEGTMVRISGYAQVRSWKDNEGEEHILKTPEIASPVMDADFLRTANGKTATADDDEFTI